MEHTVGDHTAKQTFQSKDVAQLAEAACKGKSTTIERLVKAGVDPNAKGAEGITPLLWAMSCRNLSGVAALLDSGADPNLEGDDNAAPVRVAASFHDPAILKLLLQNGGDPNSPRDGRFSALTEAMSLGVHLENWTNYYILLNAGADINMPHGDETVAEVAVAFGHFSKAVELVERGYSHDLERLALTAHVSQVDPASADAGQKKLLLEMLRARGVPVEQVIKKFEDTDPLNERAT